MNSREFDKLKDSMKAFLISKCEERWCYQSDRELIAPARGQGAGHAALKKMFMVILKESSMPKLFRNIDKFVRWYSHHSHHLMIAQTHPLTRERIAPALATRQFIGDLVSWINIGLWNNKILAWDKPGKAGYFCSHLQRDTVDDLIKRSVYFTELVRQEEIEDKINNDLVNCIIQGSMQEKSTLHVFPAEIVYQLVSDIRPALGRNVENSLDHRYALFTSIVEKKIALAEAENSQAATSAARPSL